ncbi:hypothetical protein HGA91_00300 [candidate division WWE3 bacterium]|nr:hypothetical protein [candidate division WWE3 bacterium]
MRLTLDPADLKPEHQEATENGGIMPTLNPSLVRFEHFKPEVQDVIRRVGEATYFTWDRSSYNAIIPPRVVFDGDQVRG